MATFDFVSGDEFRASLEADYRELLGALEVKAWKAVHVLAGSIVETILVDYLVATDYQKRKSVDPLSMSLGALIKACRDEGILSERSQSLSAVVKDYRNLIHPGRVIRLREVVDENGANVARALVEMIVGEVASVKQEKFGYTAEQVLAKLEHDSSALPIFPHLLRSVNQSELERLLVLLPRRYLDYILSEEDYNQALSALPQYFRPAFERADIEVKARIARSFAKILREESDHYIRTYANSFFRPTDIQFLPSEDAALVAQYWLSSLKAYQDLPSQDFVHKIEGVGAFISTEDVNEFVDAAVRVVIRTPPEEDEPTDLYSNVYAEWQKATPEVQDGIRGRLETWTTWLEGRGQHREAGLVRDLRSWLNEFSPEDLPF